MLRIIVITKKLLLAFKTTDILSIDSLLTIDQFLSYISFRIISISVIIFALILLILMATLP